MIQFNISLVIEGPLLTKDSSASVQGVDASSFRNAEGRFLIPDTLIKGRLSDAWADLEDQLALADPPHQAAAGARVRIDREMFLGYGADLAKARQGASPHGQRGRLRFSDLVAAEGIREARQVRVKLDETRLAASDQMLVELESAGEPGEQLTFTGRLDADLPDDEAEEARLAVEVGLRWITAIGGLTGVGFGTVLEAHVTRAPSSATASTVLPTHDDQVELVLQSDRALCVMGHTPVYQNVFESLDYVPGNVLKGALASAALRRAGLHGQQALTEQVLTGHGVTDGALLALARHLSAIRVRHALPGTASGPRPRTVPLSLFKVGTDIGVRTTCDAALESGPVLIDGRAPAFLPDWRKDDLPSERARFGWTEPTRSLRVRTAIERGKRRARDEALFAHERVQLAEEDAAWRAVIDVAAVTDPKERALVVDALTAVINGGIGPLGKSKAFMHPIPSAAGSPHADPALLEDGLPFEGDGRALWVVVLQTEAMLGSPTTYAKQGALSMYHEVWADLSEGALLLRSMFAQQQLCGGSWLHERFRRSRGLPYSPYLLTRAGSVFVLEAGSPRDSKAIEKVSQWRRLGLPVDAGALSFYSLDPAEPLWMQCPFLPENGYGEVAVNQRLHQEWQPSRNDDLEIKEVVVL